LTIWSGHDGAEVDEVSGDGVLAMPVRLHGIELGRPVDLLLDREALRVVGLDVRCGDDVHRFLPLPTASIADGALSIHSPLVMLEAEQLAFYRSRSFTLASVKRRAVTSKGREIGVLRDIVFARDGALLALVLDGGERVSFDETLAFAPQSRSAA
jgi:uncharacterized protein YrrD